MTDDLLGYYLAAGGSESRWVTLIDDIADTVTREVPQIELPVAVIVETALEEVGPKPVAILLVRLGRAIDRLAALPVPMSTNPRSDALGDALRRSMAVGDVATLIGVLGDMAR